MSADVAVAGPRRTISLTPADTNEATLVAASANYGFTAIWLCVANRENAANTWDLQWNDGSTDHNLFVDKSTAANDSFIPPVFHVEVPRNGSLKVTSDDADEITFTVTIVENVGNVGSRQGV